MEPRPARCGARVPPAALPPPPAGPGAAGGGCRRAAPGSRRGATATNQRRDLGLSLNPFTSRGLGFSTCEIEVMPALPASLPAARLRGVRGGPEEMMHVDLLCKCPCAENTAAF